MLSPEEIERGKKLEAEATPADWYVAYGGLRGDTYFTIACRCEGHVGVVTEYVSPSPRKSHVVIANASLIAYLRNHAPALLSAAETVNKVRELMANLDSNIVRRGASPWPVGSISRNQAHDTADAIDKLKSLIAESEGAR